MNIENLKDYLLEQKTEKKPLVYPRELKVRPTSELITVIIGPRRAGKTFYFFYLMAQEENALYLDFEDSRLTAVNGSEFREIINIYLELFGKKPKRIFFDEVQVAEDWETGLRDLYNKMEYELFLTGSSSKLLSREIATKLRGRTLTYWLLPLSFREYLEFNGMPQGGHTTKAAEAAIRAQLQEYITFGGFPAIAKIKELPIGFAPDYERDKLLREYHEQMLLRDFIDRHQIKNSALARFLFSFIIQNFSKEMSINKIYSALQGQKQVRGSKDTDYDYVAKLQDTASVFFLGRYSRTVYLRESWPKKVYVCDTGLTRIGRYDKDVGKLEENTVFLELLRMRNIDPLLELFYYKQASQPQQEVDFVLKHGEEITELIQVCHDMDDPDTKKREITSLINASAELKCDKLTIINWHYEAVEEHSGKQIRIIPLWKWLLKTPE